MRGQEAKPAASLCTSIARGGLGREINKQLAGTLNRSPGCKPRVHVTPRAGLNTVEQAASCQLPSKQGAAARGAIFVLASCLPERERERERERAREREKARERERKRG